MNAHRLAGAVVFSAVAVAFACRPAGGAEMICFEAETAQEVTAPMAVVDAGAGDAQKAVKDAAEEAYVEIAQGKGNPPDVEAGEAVYTFSVSEPGEFALWARAWWDDQCGNSVTMILDDGLPFTFGQDSTYKRWHWVKNPPRLKQLKLEAGEHTLRVKNREDGIRIDQILLTTDQRYVPVGVEDVTTTGSIGAESDGAGAQAR